VTLFERLKVNLFLAEAHRVLELSDHSQREEKQAKEKRQLKAIVGELMELKKQKAN
jgi:hypothetical protein